MLSSSLLIHWPEATVPDLFLFTDPRVSAYKLSPNCITASGSLRRRLSSNQCMQTRLLPSSVYGHLCVMPLLMLYVFSAPHPTSEQGNSHSSRTYSNKPLQNRWRRGLVVCVLRNSYLEAKARVFLESRSKSPLPSFCVGCIHTFIYVGVCVYVYHRSILGVP